MASPYSTTSPNPSRPHISFFSSSPDGQFNTIRLNRSLDSAAPNSKLRENSFVSGKTTKPQSCDSEGIQQQSESRLVNLPLKTSTQTHTGHSEKSSDRILESNLSLNPSLLPISIGIFSTSGPTTATLDSHTTQNPSLSNLDHHHTLPPTSIPSSSSIRQRSDRPLAEFQPTTENVSVPTNPCLFTLDKPLTPQQSQINVTQKTTQPTFTRNLSLTTPSPPPVASLISAQQSTLVQSPPQILSPQASAPLPTNTSACSISRFNPKTQSLIASKFVSNLKQTPPPFSITSPPDVNPQHHHRRSYSISQPISSLVQESITQPLAVQPLAHQHSDPTNVQPIQKPITQSSLKVESNLPQSELGVRTGNTKIFKSYSTRESNFARLKREEEENRLSKSFSTKEYKGGSPRLLPPVVFKTRTSSVKSHSRASFIRSRRHSPPSSVVDRDYISPFSPTFQRRNSQILQAPTEPLEIDRETSKDSPFSPRRSVRSNRSFRSTRSHTVVSRGPSSSSRSPSRSASVRFLRKSFRKITNPLSNQSLISTASEPNKSHTTLDSTTIQVTDHDLPVTSLESGKQPTSGSAQPKKDSATNGSKREHHSSSEASSPSDLQKSRKLRTFQSQDNQDSDQLSESSSHR